MEELKVKIKLPAEITVNIPALTDLDTEYVFKLLAKEGMQYIRETINDLVIDAFIKKNGKFIRGLATKIYEEKQEEMREILKANYKYK